MFETYRMLGRERENELLAEAERLRPLQHRRLEPHHRVTLLACASVALTALLVRLGTTISAAKENTMHRIFITLAFVIALTAVPVAQADRWGAVDPPFANAIRMHQLNESRLDPPFANVIRENRLDESRLDPPFANAIRSYREAAQKDRVAVRVATAGFDWSDFAVGAGAMLALLLGLGVVRKAASTLRTRHSLSV